MDIRRKRESEEYDGRFGETKSRRGGARAHQETVVERERVCVSSNNIPKGPKDVERIYESSLRAGHGWRESLYRHQGCLRASNCGRLGRQAASHPWSALRVVKAAEK